MSQQPIDLNIDNTEKEWSTMAENGEKISVMKLAENSMAHAMLIFLMADLRNLSATGRIRTKFESLNLDSDKYPRGRAPDYAGHGVTAAHIMAVLLLEITRASDELKVSRDKKDKKRKTKPVLLDDEADEQEFVFGWADIQAAGGLPALLKGYNNMVAEDIVQDIQLISKSEWPLDPPDEETAASSNLGRSDFEPDVVDDEEEDLFSSVWGRPRPTLPTLRHDGAKANEDLQEIVSVHESLFLNAALQADGGTEYYNKEELVALLEQAIEKRDFPRLGFMRNFFKEGSICSLLLESKLEVVCMSDWHLQHECTYSISVDKEKKQVFLALRGSKSRSDSARAFDVNFTATSNPIQDNYPGRPRNIKIRANYHKYLFRVRKDTGTTKYDEIISKLSGYCDQVGDGVTISMTGHSIGAALATVVAFYASTDERFTRTGAIEVVSFGCPYVGGFKFADAVMHQESAGKLRIARFHNSRDGVAHLPPTLVGLSKRGATYFNNGIDIRLPLIRKGAWKIFGQPQPIVGYNGRKSFMQSWMQQIKVSLQLVRKHRGSLKLLTLLGQDFYFFNLPLRFWLGSKMHPLVEHKKRMLLVNLLKDPETSPLVRYSLEELYEMREDLMQLVD